MGNWFRNPKTRNEERQAAGHVLDGLKVRACRYGHGLPDTYDDIARTDVRDRSWKRFRKSKWITRAPREEAAGGGMTSETSNTAPS